MQLQATAMAVLISAAALTMIGASAERMGSGSENWLGPKSWCLLSLSVWLTYALVRGWDSLGNWDRRQLAWGCASAAAFLYFLCCDVEFESWGDVYFFCGRRLQYCTCNFRWNGLGWAKATVLWNFILTAALGAQRLLIQVGLNGLLPGRPPACFSDHSGCPCHAKRLLHDA